MSQTKKGLEVLQNDVLCGCPAQPATRDDSEAGHMADGFAWEAVDRQAFSLGLLAASGGVYLTSEDKFASLEVLEACRNLGESNTSGSGLSGKLCHAACDTEAVRF